MNQDKNPTMLTDKRIIITGAAQGIGAVIAQGVASLGAKVCLADVADTSSAVKSITDAGNEAIGVFADVTSNADCEAMVHACSKQFGRVDGLVCNAALFAQLPIAAFDEIDEETWDRVMAVNVKGPWLCTKAASAVMKSSGGGSIVMISTNRIYQGYPGLLHYDASKGAVLAMTRSLIRELGPHKIRVNTVAPGLTMSEGVLAREGIQKRAPAIAAQRSLARDQLPEDLVGVVAFFLSDHSAFVTGQSLIADGGGITR